MVRLSEPRPELRVLSSKVNVPIIPRGKLHRMGAWPSPGPKDTQAYVQDYCQGLGEEMEAWTGRSPTFLTRSRASGVR